MNKINQVWGKILYALLFLGVLPIFLWIWADQTGYIVSYPSIGSLPWGLSICIAGGLLMIWGMFALIIYGKGLPMNAYPPEKIVRKGPYRLLRHPIYCGFGILLIGASIISDSASALWLVTPITILSMTALVMGYEKIRLEGQFPDQKVTAYLDISRKEPGQASIRDRLLALAGVSLFLLLGNAVIAYLVGGIQPLLGKSWNIHPVFDTQYVNFISLIFFIGVPLVLKKREQIREWILCVLIALTILVYISMLWPAVGAQYFHPEFLSWSDGEKQLYALMSVPLFLILLSLRFYVFRFRRIIASFYAMAILLGIYQLDNSRSSIIHMVVAIAIFMLAANHYRTWMFLRNLAERVANSWKEWVFGPIRIINHGIYAGLGAFLGILLSGWLAGQEYAWAILVFAIVVIVFSALWAQLIEGSDKLKRPFGYYGALVGIIVSGLVVSVMGYNVWVIIGVVSVVMPWVQAIGRFRCLINGCCHGSPTRDPRIGIRYLHHRSRVCGISGLKGELLHPTHLYAILWLFFLGFLLLALWINRLPYSFIFGLYLILTGLGRFVEEAYRGEIQTPILSGLRLYQWTAIASVIFGILMTFIPVSELDIHQEFGWEIVVAALLGGLFTFFVMGVDFPRSNARFSRLV